LAVPAFEEHPHVAHRLLVLFGRAQAAHAGAEAALDVILKTGARELAVDLDVAGAELERPVDEVNGAARERGREVRAEVERAVALNAARDHHAREGLADGELEV